MSGFANFPRLLQSYFVERLMNQQQASPHTVASHRDTFRLLLAFMQKRLKKAPSDLAIQDVDASMIGAFLDHLERERGNSARSRNVRLAAIHSFYRYVALCEPIVCGIAQRVLAVPRKRYIRKQVSFLTPDEIDALLAAPDPSTWTGRRDHILILVALQTGLRVSELAGLRWDSLVLGHGAHVRCSGKGRKERCTPLRRDAVKALGLWAREVESHPSSPVFPNARGGHLSRDGIQYIVRKHAKAASRRCGTLKYKRVSPHVLRHTTAMNLLQHGVDRSVIALWLGHESVNTTDVYLDANLQMKERALARITSPHIRPGRYRPDDQVLAFLKSL